MLSATESAMCSLEMMPMISDRAARGRSPLTTTAMAGVMACHALHHVEHDVALARDGEIALRHVAERTPL